MLAPNCNWSLFEGPREFLSNLRGILLECPRQFLRCLTRQHGGLRQLVSGSMALLSGHVVFFFARVWLRVFQWGPFMGANCETEISISERVIRANSVVSAEGAGGGCGQLIQADSRLLLPCSEFRLPPALGAFGWAPFPHLRNLLLELLG